MKLIGLYKTSEAARKAKSLMTEHGVTASRTSLLMPDDIAGPHLAAYAHHQAASYAWIGAALGALLGGVVLGGLAVGEIELEGIAQLAGHEISALVGVAVLAPLGALIGALVGWRRPILRADFFEPDDKRGGTALGVQVRSQDELDAAEFAFRSTGALQVRSRGTSRGFAHVESETAPAAT